MANFFGNNYGRRSPVGAGRRRKRGKRKCEPWPQCRREKGLRSGMGGRRRNIGGNIMAPGSIVGGGTPCVTSDDCPFNGTCRAGQCWQKQTALDAEFTNIDF